jgi:hypothetical protein
MKIGARLKKTEKPPSRAAHPVRLNCGEYLGANREAQIILKQISLHAGSSLTVWIVTLPFAVFDGSG